MPSQWEQLTKPTDSNWGNLPKPSNSITTTTVATLHSKGKFMGILGLTYTGSTTTTTSTVTSGWQTLSKPTGGWETVAKPTT